MQQLTNNEVISNVTIGHVSVLVTFIVKPVNDTVTLQTNTGSSWVDVKGYTDNEAVDVPLHSGVQWRFTIPNGSTVSYYYE